MHTESVGGKRQILGVEISTLVIHMWLVHCKRCGAKETRHIGLEHMLIYCSMHTGRLAICAKQTLRFCCAEGIISATVLTLSQK